MAEPKHPSVYDVPDFEKIAWNLRGFSTTEIAEQLRQVWNARGDADSEALERVLLKLGGPPKDDPHSFQESTLGRAIKVLDR